MIKQNKYSEMLTWLSNSYYTSLGSLCDCGPGFPGDFSGLGGICGPIAVVAHLGPVVLVAMDMVAQIALLTHVVLVAYLSSLPLVRGEGSLVWGPTCQGVLGLVCKCDNVSQNQMKMQQQYLQVSTIFTLSSCSKHGKSQSDYYFQMFRAFCSWAWVANLREQSFHDCVTLRA